MDAYLDTTAGELVRRAREHRALLDRALSGYETTAAERTSIGLRAGTRDRLLWQREVASRIAWERDGPVRIEVLGAREVLPTFDGVPHVPAGLAGYVPQLVFDPGDPYLLADWGGDGDIGEGIRHPLEPGSEADYRFGSGGTTTLRLSGGQLVRLFELRVVPRRKDGNLVHGSLWLEESSHAVVRATFRLAGDLDLDTEGDLPAILKPLVGQAEYLTIEYGLWDSRWWLPRVLAIRGVGRVGRMMTVPFLYERRYSDYKVEGAQEGTGTTESPEEIGSPAGERCPARMVVAARPPPLLRWLLEEDSPTGAPSANDGSANGRLTDAQRRACERFEVVIVGDAAELLTSPHLAGSAFSQGEALLTETELSSIRSELASLPGPRFDPARPQIKGPHGDADLIRYNRVEGLSLGIRGDLDVGPVQAAALARLGTADREPNSEISLAREGRRYRLQFGAYRRLTAMDPHARPFSPGGSLGSLILGRDEADFYRVTGAELILGPSAFRPAWYGWRLYAQDERAAEKRTDLSLPYLLDRAHRFPLNDPADRATQYGAAVRVRQEWGADPLGFRASGGLDLDGGVGTFDYARASLTLRGGFPLPGPFVGMLEAASGTVTGGPGFQHLWRLGGSATLRGYPAGTLVGRSFWRGRAEVATELPSVRLAFFSDAASAASPEDDYRPWLLSAGAGISLLDGLLRLDLARALHEPTAWRLTAYLDAWQ